jgi:hypothetical protein
MGAIKGYVLGFGFGSAQPAIIRDLRAERVVLRYPELTEGSLSKGSPMQLSSLRRYLRVSDMGTSVQNV